MTDLQKMLMTIGQNILVFVLVLAAGGTAVHFFSKLIRKAVLKTRLDHTVKTFLFSFIRVMLFSLVALAALAAAQVDVTSIITALGATLITAGFALQDTLKNFVSGIIVLFSKPFTAGDLIQFEGYEGYVKNIRIFYTTITTYENTNVRIPNSKLTSSNVVNCSEEETRRVSFSFTISYEDSIAKAKSVIFDVISKNDKIVKAPEPKVYTGKHLDSGVEIIVFVWADPADYFPVYFSMQENVKLAFEENGITIPYPHVQVQGAADNSLPRISTDPSQH